MKGEDIAGKQPATRLIGARCQVPGQAWRRQEPGFSPLEAACLERKGMQPHLSKHSFGAEPAQTLLSNSKAVLFRKFLRGKGQLHAGNAGWGSSWLASRTSSCCLEITDCFPTGGISYYSVPSPHDVGCPGRAQQIRAPCLTEEMLLRLETLKQLKVLAL